MDERDFFCGGSGLSTDVGADPLKKLRNFKLEKSFT